MKVEIVLFFSLIFLHFIGFVLFTFNAVYLICTRGYGSARISQTLFDRRGSTALDDPQTGRCCKMTNTWAGNLLVLYHVILTFVDILEAIRYEVYQPTNTFFLIGFWAMAAWNYGLLVLVVFSAYAAIPHETGIPARHLHAYHSYEFLHFFIFWASLLLMLTCTKAECDFQSPLKNLANGYAAIPLVLSYVVLVIEAWTRGYTEIKVITKEEAVDTINQRQRESPWIEWTIRCRHQDGEGSQIDTFYVDLSLSIVFFILCFHISLHVYISVCYHTS